ncbi:MAG TPA: hypothetical protein VF105_11055 [Gemmatimonadaceae bacterium]
MSADVDAADECDVGCQSELSVKGEERPISDDLLGRVVLGKREAGSGRGKRVGARRGNVWMAIRADHHP